MDLPDLSLSVSYHKAVHISYAPEDKNAGAIRDVLEELEDGAARTEVECQKCGHGFAYFNQLQIRSADEPMTIFYKCVACGTVRQEN
ncbi:transcription factor S-II-domain-containing protein [Mycena capillaripes]|nr:transcription factor S-II-domain-containing protein [Mycena capillaripes]